MTVWFIYDGDCPICNIAAQGLRIRATAGNLQLINAREDRGHPVMQEIQQKGLSLDEGMVIKYEGILYHGKDALHSMALLGSNIGWFNRMNAILFRSKILCTIFYPMMRTARNILLSIRSIKPIKNLETEKKSNSPIFQFVLGKSWNDLSSFIHKRYANRPYSNDIITIKGVMDIELGKFTRITSPLLRLISPLPIYDAQNVPVTVDIKSSNDNDAFYFNRTFHFINKSPFHFRSFMAPMGDNCIIEYITGNIGCRLNYAYLANKVVITHGGYVLKMGSIIIPLPFTWLIGRIYAEEYEICKDLFSMIMNITHPLFDKLYEYKGIFKIISNDAK